VARVVGFVSFVVAYVLAVFPFLPFRLLVPRFYWFVEGMLYRNLQAFIGYWGYTAGFKVYEFGDDISEYGKNERVLFVCNHQGMADVPTLFAVMQSKGVATRKTMWVMDEMFKWYPFGIVGQMHGDFFIRQGRDTREGEIKRFRQHMKDVFWDRDRRWVIIFPEGGFYNKRFETSQKYAKSKGFEHPEHVTLPRIGSAKAVLEEIGPRLDDEEVVEPQAGNPFEMVSNYVSYLFGAIREKHYVKVRRPPVRYIIDATIAYPDKEHPFSLLTLILGNQERSDIAIHYKVYSAEEVPYRDEEAMREWMYEAYMRKDRMLDNYYKTGTFVPGEIGHPIVFTPEEIIFKYVAWVSLLFCEYLFYRWILFGLTSV